MLGHGSLFSRFHQYEPWECPHNFSLIGSNMEVGNWVRVLGLIFPRSGNRSKSQRRFKAVPNSPGVAHVDVLEDRLLLTSDFGDAPDTTVGTGVNNYQTLAANGGPSHVIDTTQNTLYLSGGVDGEAGTQQSLAANLDNLFTTGGRNDEEGVMSSLDLTATIGSSPKITLSATNTTGTAATLYGWIDYNHNGVFENATERAQITVPTETTAGLFTLQFPKIIGDVAGGTYARFRLSSDAAASNSTGAANGGEVEDYQFQIMNRVNLRGDAPSTLGISSGVNGGPLIPAEDGFGYTATVPIGDLDGNGVVDLASGAVGGNIQGSYRGAVYILFRNADGTVSRYGRIANGINGGPELAMNDSFGISIVNLGDIDGDGVTDIAVGSTNYNGGSALYIVRLNVTGTAKNSTKLMSGQNGVPDWVPGSSFRAIAGLGDIDGDGIPDIAIADNNATGDGAYSRGAVYILRLNSDGTVKDSSIIQNSSTWNPAITDSNSSNYTFGNNIATIGDLDGDGVVDLAATSTKWATITNEDVTFINLLKLNTDGTLKNVSNLATGTGGTPGLDNMQSIDSITSIGDIDGNGVPDLAVSGRGTTDWAYNQSVLTLLKMNSNGTVKSFVTLPILDEYGSSSNNGLTSLTSIANIDGSRSIGIGMPFYGRNLGSLRSNLTMFSLVSAIPATTTPATPVLSNLTAPTTAARPEFSWNESSTATEYEIWLKNMSTGEVLLQSISVNGTTYTPTAALGIGKYAVSVRAMNEIGPSAWSRTLNFTINSAVYAFSPWGGMNRRPGLEWRTLAGAAHYDIWVSDSRTPNVAVFSKRTNSNTETFTLDQDLPDGTYRFQVRGVAADGMRGAWSQVNVFTIDTTTEIQQITQQFTLRPRIEWEVVLGATAYDVYVTPLKPGSAPIQSQVSALDSSALISTNNLASGDYRAWVRAVAADGSRGPWSAFRNFSAGAALHVESSTYEPTPQSFAWLTIPSMVGAKYIDVWIDDPAPGISPASSGLRRLNYSSGYAPQLAIQGKYRVWIRIIADDGSMTRWSSPVDLTVRGTPSNVRLFDPGYGIGLSVVWEFVAGAAEYEIQLRNVDSNMLRTIHTIGRTNLRALSSLELLGRYEVSVRAISSDGTVGLWGNLGQPYVSVPPLNLPPILPTFNTTPQFQWNAVEDAVSYDVIVRHQTTHTVEFTARGVTSTSYTSPKLVIGNYELWVIANGANGIRSQWASQQFQITAKPKPILNSVGPGFEAGNTGWVITWTFALTADHYEIWISNSRGVLAVHDVNISTTTYTLTTLLPRDIFYRVWVRAVDADGTNSAWSDPDSFQVN